jgi:hypothetical protein
VTGRLARDAWISGDGGPIVLLQSTAAAAWRGATDSGVMAGGTVEDDYDVICRCADGVTVLRRHDRDMAVLGDAETGARFVRGRRRRPGPDVTPPRRSRS